MFLKSENSTGNKIQLITHLLDVLSYKETDIKNKYILSIITSSE